MSLSFSLGRQFGVERLENFVGVAGQMIPDREVELAVLMRRMRDGQVFTTAQTSAAAVSEFLDRQLACCEQLFYVAVGNPYTGTQALVRQVAENHPQRHRLHVFDTRAASAQQGLICLAAARYAARDPHPEELKNFISNQVSSCREYIVIDNLEYLSRTGRIGRIKAAFAGVLSIRPIVAHGGDGAITVAKVRSHEQALEEICRRAREHPGQGPISVLLEHTDNADWVDGAAHKLRAILPKSTHFDVSPLSSTSAVHMGPGTWGVAITRLG